MTSISERHTKSVKLIGFCILLFGLWFLFQNIMYFANKEPMSLLSRIIHLSGAIAYIICGSGIIFARWWGVLIFVGIVPYALAYYLILWFVFISNYGRAQRTYNPPFVEYLGLLLMAGAIIAPLLATWYLTRPAVLSLFMEDRKPLLPSSMKTIVSLYTLWTVTAGAFVYTQYIAEHMFPNLAFGSLAISFVLLGLIRALQRKCKLGQVRSRS